VKANQPNIIFILADDLGEKQFFFFEKLSSSVCLQLHLNYKMFPVYFYLDKY
jgi:arylsulfatase A-like enzyme